MMTSLPSHSANEPSSQPDASLPAADGRTVRDIVEQDHALVTEPWCRRIFRQLLQSLEVQYGMRMPHRRITPDTILILESGDPMLLPDGDEVADDARIADDLRDLAGVIHYAITLELLPEGPLRGRGLPGYSDSFLLAIDRCMAQEVDQRPQSIEALRNLLGIVVLAPPQPAPATLGEDAPPAVVAEARREPPAPPPAEERQGGRRWLLLGAAALLLVAALAALLMLLRQTDARDALALPTPLSEPSHDAQAMPGSMAPAQEAPAPLVTLPQALEGHVIDETGMDAQQGLAPPTAVQLAPRGAAATAGTTYKLVIQPWGRIVVDGIERGVSPPLKHLTLPPGEHTIRILNPSFPEHTVTVRSAQGEQSVIEMDFRKDETP